MCKCSANLSISITDNLKNQNYEHMCLSLKAFTMFTIIMKQILTDSSKVDLSFLLSLKTKITVKLRLSV